MYSVEMSPSVSASAVAMELPAPGAMRELSAEELLLVSGAWSWGEFGGAVFAGAVTGGMVGAMVGGAGVGPGALGGALIGGAGYAALYAWNGLISFLSC